MSRPRNKHRNRRVTITCEDGYVSSFQDDRNPFEVNADMPWFDHEGKPHGKPVSVTFSLNGVEVGTVYGLMIHAEPADDDAVSKGVADGQ